MSRITILTVLLMIFMSCNPDGPHRGASGLQVHTYDQMNSEIDALNSHAGQTGRSSLAFIGDTYVRLGKAETIGNLETKDVGVCYPRFVKTEQGDWLMFFHYINKTTPAGNKCSFVRSHNLIDWTFEKMLFAPVTGCRSEVYGDEFTRVYAGVDCLLLPDGRIMAVAATRRLADYQNFSADNGLAVRYSSDGGRTWTADQFIGVGSCWEPKPLLLPDGTIHIYYTDSDKIYKGIWAVDMNNSGSSYVYSDDNGISWTGAEGEHLLAFRQEWQRKGDVVIYTDQMPAVTMINGTNMIAAAAESDVAADITKDEYNISLAYTDEDGSWGEPDADGEIPADRSDDLFKGCAPYLMQFRSGESILSYNSSSVFYYRMGNEKVRNFGEERRVFDWDAGVGKGFWGTVIAADDHVMLAAVGGGSIKETDTDDSNWRMELGRFYLNHNIAAPQESISVDGNNSEWKGTEALFVGSGCIRTPSGKAAQTLLRAAHDADNLYLTVDAVGIHTVEINFSSGYVNVDNSGLVMSTITGVKVVSQKGRTTSMEQGYVSEVSIPLKTFGRNPKLIPVRIAASDGVTRDLMASDYASTWPGIQIR